MSERINPEYLAPALAALRAWVREYRKQPAVSATTKEALFDLADRLFAAPEPAVGREPLCAAAGCGTEAWIWTTVGRLDGDAISANLCSAHSAAVRKAPAPEPAPRSEAERAVLAAVRAWAAFVQRTGYAVHRGPSEIERLTRTALALYPEQPPTHCAMPRCGKAFVSPEPWYFERGDGVLLPLCHNCHYVVQQPR